MTTRPLQSDRKAMEETAPSIALASAVKAAWFRKFFTLLEQKGIPYAVLSNYFAYPEEIHSDVDFVVPEPHRLSIPSLVQSLCRESDAHLLQISEYHNTTAFSCFVATLKGVVPIHLRFDVCSDDHRRDKLILPWQFMLEGRRRYAEGFFVPAPEKSLLHYLLKRVEKRSLQQSQLAALYKWFQDAPEESQQILRRYWPTDYGQILGCILDQVPPQAESLDAWSRNVQLRDARQTVYARAAQYMKEIRRKVRRVRQPLGFLVAFLGPDGCGKSTALVGVTAALHPAFAHTAEYHLLVKHRGRKEIDTSRPHAKKPRSPVTSMAKALFWFLDLWLGYWTKLRPKMVRSTLIIFDRYVHDLQVDRTRYRYSGPEGWPRLLSALSPQPHLWILLDAPPEVLWRRKPELTQEESARQLDAYRRLLAAKPNARVIDACQPPEQVVADVCSEVFRRLEARTAERYKHLLG